MKPQKTLYNQSSLENEEKDGVIMHPDFRLLQSYRNQNSMVQTQNRHRNQQKRIQSPEIKPYVYGLLIYDKGTRNIYQERTVYLIDGVGNT